jgi:hypothetical protein
MNSYRIMEGSRMVALAQLLEEMLPNGAGFSLMVFGKHQNGPDPQSEVQYISNCDRDEMVVVLERMAARWRDQQKQERN